MAAIRSRSPFPLTSRRTSSLSPPLRSLGGVAPSSLGRSPFSLTSRRTSSLSPPLRSLGGVAPSSLGRSPFSLTSRRTSSLSPPLRSLGGVAPRLIRSLTRIAHLLICSSVSCRRWWGWSGGRDRPFDGGEGVVDGLGIRPAALGEVVLAATATAEGLGGDADQPARLEAPIPGRLTDRDDHNGAVLRHPGDGHDGGPPAEPSAYVHGQPAQIVGAGAVGGAVRDEADSVHVAGAVGQRPSSRQNLLGPDPLQLLLGVPEPGDDAGDALGEFGARRFQLLRQLADEHALLGEEAEGVDAHERLHPPDARADGFLAEHLDQAELPGPRDVRAAA